MIWGFSSIVEIRLLYKHWTVHNLECVRHIILVSQLMKVFPYAYSVLDTYYETFPKESARMMEDSSSVIRNDQLQELHYDFRMFPPPSVPAYRSVSSFA